MPHRIILTHIPRTGGTSLFTALRAQQANAKVVELQSFAEVALMNDKQLDSYEIISTYVGSRIFDRLNDSWIKVIVLRDPVARLKSSYLNLRNTRENLSFASSIAKTHSFRDYLSLRDAAVIFQASNVQTWTVLGDKSLYYRQQFAGVTAEEIIAIAVERLKLYNFVGFTEDLQELWSRMCHHFGWAITSLPRLRSNPPLEVGEDPRPEDLNFHTQLDAAFVRLVRTVAPTGPVESAAGHPR